MEVAQHPGRRRIDDRGQQLAPKRAERAAFGIGDRGVKARQKPVEQQLGFDQERVHVVGRNAIIELRCDRQRVGQLLRMKRKEHVDRGLVALDDRRRRIAAHHARVAEVFEDQETVLEVGVMDGGRRQAQSLQSIRHRHERHDSLGEMRDGAIGLVAPHRRAVGPARRIHQQHALIAEREPLVRARRGVAAQRGAQRFAVAALGDELAHRRHAVDARRQRAKAGDAGVAEFELELGRQRERNVESIGRQKAVRAVGPLEQHHRAFRQVVEAELGELGRPR